MIRVLIADDHPVMRAGLSRILESDPHIKVMAEASNGFEVLDYLRAQPCDALVLDLAMPGMDGIETLKQVRSEGFRIGILVLSAHGEAQYGIRLLKAGASGFLNKEAAPEELVNAIRQVASGRRYIGATLAERLADYVDEDARKPHERLSDREFEIFKLAAGGASSAEIAQSLKLGISTVSTYKARIRQKTGLDSDAALARYALENGLL